tara:strand:+ start:2977 stop:3324 length:348 start_codon:yes stop_codon:yes gene_type:complete
MAYFAKIENNIVTDVIVADQEFVNNLEGTWLETDKKTYQGKHKDGETPFRKNYAGIGYTYDSTRDAFIPPQVFPSWVLNEETCCWDPPIPYPDDFKTVAYDWDEENVQWVLMPVE